MYQRQVSFGEAVKKALTVNYCNFQGRASRSEYWWFCLFTFLVGFVAGIATCWSPTVNKIVSWIISLVFLLPSLGLSVRRLHDTGRSGWWLLLSIIPIANLVVLYFLIQPSQTVPNQYGGVPNLTEGNI